MARFVELYERHKNLHIPDTLMDYVAQGVKRWVQGNRDPWPTTKRRKLPHGPVRDAARRVTAGVWSREEALERLFHQFEDVDDATLAVSLDEQIRNVDLLDDYIEETYRKK